MASVFGSCFCGDSLNFVDAQHPILNKVCVEVPADVLSDSEMQIFFDAMFKLARGEQEGGPQKAILVGLAAPQIGVDMRVILVDVQADGKGGVAELRLYINPEILEVSVETEEFYEGCYSTGDIKGVVNRPSQVTIQALDRNGNWIRETHTGYIARIFQHEIDHLNGIRFPERVSKEGNLHLVAENEIYNYRNLQGWRNWSKTLPQRDWRTYLQSKIKK